ncbi:nitrate reductase [Thalassobius vesicularis]|uniref:Nitrate reductase n=1 Tax=Thalassobius vesicularis TaxID=1294297 RepID=A0A4S3M6E9_9RHOB|nr:nitrate reductase [Thalassobius vesicularis]THD72636.1 nitrate reductase [Thalassobius vesicularis]
MKNLQFAPASTCKTTCPYCGVGCGVLVSPEKTGGIKVKADPDHPANLGRLCSKGTALAETIWLDDRLLHPQVNGARASWDDALELVAQRFKGTIAEHGPDSVAFYVSGQLLTEDYYVANKLMKGFIGSANIDTNSRLCMASSVAGHKRAFGTDTVPGQYTDLEQADLVVLTGSNLAWCHPVLYQRIVAAKKANPKMKVVNIDPRRTATSDIADLHLAIAPGGDAALFNRLLVEIHEQGAVDSSFVGQHVDGFDDAVNAASSCDSTVTGLSEADIRAFCNMWIGTEKVVTVYSQGVNQSSAGSDKVNAILNCHLATGRIGQPGMGPFSVTGQPNAMGGREVGGLANMLACHLDLENAEHRSAVKTFWAAPDMPEAAGLKAVDMFNAVAEGRIKAIWIMCTNPVVSMPDADAVKAALEGCDFVVVSDLTADTDTAKLAHVVLPATGWGEKDGTVTNSERCISRQRGFLPAPGEARHDWDIMSDVGRRMGWHDAFDYQSPAEIFREYAVLSGIAGQLGRDFDISGLSDLGDDAYDSLEPLHWPVTAIRAGGRFFGDGRFFTPSGKARMLPIHFRTPQSHPSAQYPFRLNTGRVRDHWHTMTRSAKSSRLSQHLAEPYLEIHPSDATRLGIAPADIVRVTSPQGASLLRALVTDRVHAGQVFAPMHWTAQYASAGRVDTLVAAHTDPVSGQPESKASVVNVEKFQAKWYGFAVSLAKPRADTAYWAQARSGDGWRIELAATDTPEDWETYARTLLNAPEAQAQIVQDPKRGGARIAFVQDGRLIGALFVAAEPVQVARNHMAHMLGNVAEDALAGRPSADRPDPGATICACFDVGVNTILAAIAEQKLVSVEQIGAALNAGTNCGSCRPELAALLAASHVQQAAE